LPLIDVSATSMAIEIKTAIMPYSIDVAPLSLRRNWWTDWVMVNACSVFGHAGTGAVSNWEGCRARAIGVSLRLAWGSQMTAVLKRALDIVERFDAAQTASAAGRAFFSALVPLGARGFGARAYAAGGGSAAPEGTIAFAQVLPRTWNTSASARLVESLDPLPKAARRLGRTAFLWSEASPRGDKRWAEYWAALGEHTIGEGTAVHLFAPNGMTSRVSVGFDRKTLEPRERKVVELASYALLDRMTALSSYVAPRTPLLSERERDCLSFVAQGLSDAEIGERLGITQSTAHFYIEKAKRKLGAKTRAQAVARLITSGLL
jgi:DNA-binding CsgD family transcriptional regulator